MNRKLTYITKTKKQNKGISVVLTTLIIIVASVVLGTGVIAFGTSLFQTGAQQQSMTVSQTNLWFKVDCDEDDLSSETDVVTVGSAVVRNSGDKLIAIDTIKIRGTIVPNANWYANSTVSASQSQAQMTYDSADWDEPDSLCIGTAAPPAGPVLITTFAADDVPLVKQSGPVSLDPGKTVIIYFVSSGSYDTNASNDILSATDVGAAVSVTVQAGHLSIVQSVSVQALQ
ncbi:MAG: hypothetical protein HMLIMOIP_001596 [Candidatus Nitrosomirales archaeon]|jgi:hypothetical protein